MKSGGNTQGFTIVETLIYLAVSAAIMASVLTLVGGSQNKAQFQQSVNDTNQQINEAINNVSTGYYNNPGNFKCTYDPNGPILSESLVDTQGTNDKCIFLGRVIQFGVSGDGNKMKIYNAVGLREVGGKQVTSLSESKLRLIAPGTAGVTIDFPDASETRILKNGFTAEKMYYNGDTSKITGGIAILSDFAQTNVSSSVLKSGTQSVSIFAINGTSLGQTPTSFVNEANDVSKHVKGGSGILVCFNSSTTNQYVNLTIGGDTQSLDTKLDIKDGRC